MTTKTTRPLQPEQPVSIGGYAAGFVLSVVLTGGAYIAVTHHMFSRPILLGLIMGLALAQFIVQLKFFLHIDAESKPRWRQFVFWLMVTVVVILVVGSLWIMQHLNYHMTQTQVNQYLHSQDGL